MLPYSKFLIKKILRLFFHLEDADVVLKQLPLVMMRKNTLQLKQELADSLGENGKDYWIKLGDFLVGKCSKKHLDSVSLKLFTDPYQGS